MADEINRVSQHSAPRGTVATIGHPANNVLIVKGCDLWVYIDTGQPVADEDFRAGWDVAPPPGPTSPATTAEADR